MTDKYESIWESDPKKSGDSTTPTSQGMTESVSIWGSVPHEDGSTGTNNERTQVRRQLEEDSGREDIYSTPEVMKLYRNDEPRD